MQIRRLILPVIFVAFLTRVFVAAYPGKNLATPWSSGSDMPAYVALARSLVGGTGFSYYGMASAIRPPLYPLFLAVNVLLFGTLFPVAVRVVQFGIGIVAVLISWGTARRIWGAEKALLALGAAAVFPTRIFFTGELLTECFAILIVSIFLLCIVDMDVVAVRKTIPIGIAVGVGTLVRFNLAALGLAFFLILLFRVGIRRSMWPTVLVVLISIAIISPWLVRNAVRFHGRVLLSSQTGYNLVEGVLTPDGRTQPGESQRLEKSEGWVPQQIEVNSPARLGFPDEGSLNRRAMSHVRALWWQERSEVLHLAAEKLGYFWLSTDQAFDTQSLPWRERLIRACSVGFYWLLLFFAILGWFKLKKPQPRIALALLIYAVTVTVFHFPFVMNTRLATPFLAPLVCILCPGVL